MFKMLFVGCGGSGGAIVGYLMDQLRADFRRAGVDKIPAAWQFVHVDMPPMAEPVAPGLGTIEQLGGHYIPLSPAVGKYSLLDSGVTQSPAVLSEVATWGLVTRRRSPSPSSWAPANNGPSGGSRC